MPALLLQHAKFAPFGINLAAVMVIQPVIVVVISVARATIVVDKALVAATQILGVALQAMAEMPLQLPVAALVG